MAEAKQDQPTKLEIRKYPNRRYYDTTRSRHVTLEQIHSLIREGYEIEVIDSKTEQDITAKVLAQIILDLDPPKLGVFSVPMLHRLLQSNEQMVGEFIDRYLNQPLTAFLDSQRSMEEYFRQALGMNKPAAGPSDWARAIWGPFNPAFWTKGRPGSNPASPAGSPPQQSQGAASNGGGPTQETSDTTRALLEQIASLREQVARLQAGQPGAPAPRRPRRKNSRKSK
jgi:polyhydroxyalkanoate synthesis repressor PhaR